MPEKSKELLLAEQFMDKGDFKEALQILDDSKIDLSTHDLVSYTLLKATLLYELCRFNETLEIIEDGYQDIEKLGEDLQIIDVLNIKAQVYLRLGNYEQSLEIINLCEKRIENIIDEKLADVNLRKASIAFSKAWIYFFQGKGNRTLKYGEQCLKIYEQLGDKLGIIKILSRFSSLFYIYKTDLNRALEIAQRCQKLAENLNQKRIRYHLAFNNLNLGSIYFLKGELDAGLFYSQKSLKIFEEFNDKQFINSTLTTIGLIYWEKGEFTQSKEIFKANLKQSKESDNTWGICTSLTNLIEICIEMGDSKEARTYLTELKALNNHNQNELINNWYTYCKAILYKNSNRIRDLSKAQELFIEIVSNKNAGEAIIQSLIHLCDMLFQELINSNDVEIIDEIKPLITQCLEYSESQNSYKYLSETYILQAKFALLTFDINSARQLLSQSQKIAENFGLNRTALKISNEHDELLKNLNEWETLKDRNAPINERLNLSRIDKQIVQMINKKLIDAPKLEPEYPILITILTHEGNILLSNPFTSDISIDDDRFASFISSFNTLSNQIFSESFDRVKFGQYTVLISVLDGFYICYIFQGQTYSARQKLIHFIDLLNKETKIKNTVFNVERANEILNLDDLPSFNQLILECFLSDPDKFQVPFKAYVGNDPFIFVSYTHADKLQVFPIIDYLNKNGLRIWYDEGIPLSQNWKKSIVDNLELCKVFLVFISPYIVNSEMVKKEISFALKKKKPFLAVYLKDVQLPSELEFEIADIQALMKYKLSDADFYNKLKTTLDLILSNRN